VFDQECSGNQNKGEQMMRIVEQKLRQIVTETFLMGAESGELPGDASFIDLGIIDSTGILQLVEFVEQEFGLKVDDEDLIPENLDSINRLVAFVERKKLVASAPNEQTAICLPNAVACEVGIGSPDFE
jgi:acyl carrier protein